MSTSQLLFVLASVMLAGTVAASAAPMVVEGGGLRTPGETVKVAGRRAAAESEAAGDMAGRYAVMREKRDTGCMLTLDRARVKGGARAQLAPGCRDQGIVIFDPASWALIKGELVLTARAGHKAHLLKESEGAWKKGAKDGKPLGLKKL